LGMIGRVPQIAIGEDAMVYDRSAVIEPVELGACRSQAAQTPVG
jgi:hypothetical protein